MNLRVSLAVFVIFSLSLVVVGCGGGDQADNQQDAGSKTSGGQNQQEGSNGSGGSGQEGEDAQEIKVAVGKIIAVNAERDRFVVKPAKGENMAFKAVSKARINLDGKEVDLADMENGQQVQLEYTVREEMGVPNRARSITLFSNDAGGGDESGGGSTG